MVTIDGRSDSRTLKISNKTFGTPFDNTSFKDNFKTAKEYDNYYIQHPIPRSDVQYAWITAAFGGSPSSSIRVGYAPFDTWDDGLDNSGNNPYSDLLTASLIGEYYDSNNRILAHYTNVYSNKSNAPAQIKAVQNFGITITPTRRPDRPMYSGTKRWRRVDTTFYRDVSGQLLSINTVGPGRSLKEMNANGDLYDSEHAQEVLLPFATTSSLSHEPGRSWSLQNHVGNSFLHGREEGAINPHELTFRTGPSARSMSNPVEDRFNLYLTRLNGPYGATSFNFIRNQDNLNLQASRQFNFYTVIKAPSDSLEGSGSIFSRRSDKIRWFNRVSPITSKYKPLVYGFGVTRTFKNKFNEDVEVEGTSYFKSTFANQKGYFNNEKLNEFLGLDKKENLTFYDKFKNLYLDGGLESELSPIERMQFVTYHEQVYPSSLNMYSRFVRSRVNFDMENWRNSYADRISRIRWQYQARPYKQFATEHYSEFLKFPVNQDYEVKIPTISQSEVRTSKWPMDTAHLYLSATSPVMCLADNRIAYGRLGADFASGSESGGTSGSIGGNTSKIIENPAGRLLNNHTHWHGANISSADMYQEITTIAMPNYGVYNNCKADKAVPYFAIEFISASCLYALKNVSFHSHSVYAWNRPNVCFYSGTNSTVPTKLPNPRGDRQLMAYNTHTAYKYNGYGDAPFITDETAGSWVFNTSSNDFDFVSASITPFYDNYDSFSEDVRTKNKDMSVLPEFRISSHIKALVKGEKLDTPIADMFEIPGAHNTETMPDGSGLSSLSTSGSFFKIYSNSDFMEHFEIIKDDHKDLMEPTTLTLRCSAIKKFVPYKGFYPAERTVQMFDQFMDSYGSQITGANLNWRDLTSEICAGDAFSRLGGTGSVAYGGLARPVLTPLFAPGILFNSIKSGLGVDFPVLAEEGVISPNGTSSMGGFGADDVVMEDSTSSPPRYKRMKITTKNAEFGLHATQSPKLNANRLTASLSVGPRYGNLSGGLEYSTKSTGRLTIQDRYLQIVGSNRPGTLDWSKRIPFEAIIRPEDHMGGLHLKDMFVNDATALFPSGKETRFNTAILSGIMPGATLHEPIDSIYTMMADNFVGAVPDFFLEDGELATITSKKESDLNLRLTSGDIYATRLRMRRSMNKSRDWKWDLKEIFHKTCSVEYARPYSWTAGANRRVDVSPGDATKNYILEEGQKRQIVDYEIFQDPIRQRGLYETLTMYNRPGAFGPPVTGRDHTMRLNGSWARTFITKSSTGVEGSTNFRSWTSSYGTNAVLDSSNGFNPAFTPPYYDGHAVVDIVFRVPATKEYTLAEIMQRSETQAWRFDPGWLVRRLHGTTTGISFAGITKADFTASFTLIPGEIYYKKWGDDNNIGGGVTGTLGPGAGLDGRTKPWDPEEEQDFFSSLAYGGAPYAGQHINQTSMQLDNCINIKLLGKVPSTTTDNEGNLTVRNVPEEKDKVWVIQPKWETPVLNFKDAIPYPQHSISGSTYGIENLNNRSALVAATGMWHQFGRIPQGDEGIYLEMIDIPKNWIDGHWSLAKNMNRGYGSPIAGAAVDTEELTSVEIRAAYGYNTPYTASAYDDIRDSSKIKSLKDLLGFKSSADEGWRQSGPGVGPKVKIGQLAEKKIVSEAIVAVPFIEKNRQKYFFEIDKYFIDIAKADRSPPGGVPDAGDSIKDMVEKMERYILPPSMDFVTYPEITPFSMYIFEFSHEFSKQDLANMWQNIAPNSARTFETATSQIRHDLNQDELMGFALAKSDEAFMDQVQWMVFKVKQKNMSVYEDKIAGKKPPRLSFRLASPFQLMPNFSKFKIRRVKLQNNSLKINKVQITPTFRFGRSLTEDKTQVEVGYNWPYDYFSIVEFAKIRASIRFAKPDDIEEEPQQGPQISGVSQLGPVVAQSAASKVKASTATRRKKKRKGVRGKSQKKVSVTKKSNVANKTAKGMKFSKVIKF